MTSGRIKGVSREVVGRDPGRASGHPVLFGARVFRDLAGMALRDCDYHAGLAVTLAGAVSTLATLAVFQALGNAFLVGLVAWLVISPEHVANLRRRLANIRERWGV